MDNWLKNLKAGDAVLDPSGWNNTVKTVDKTTSTTITVGTEMFCRKDGTWMGRGRYRLIAEATLDRLKDIADKEHRAGVEYKIRQFTERLRSEQADPSDDGAPHGGQREGGLHA